MGAKTAGDEMVERYLAEHGIAVPEHEPDLGIRVLPEYVVEVQGKCCLCEVKEFAESTNSLPGTGPWGGKIRHKPIRTQVHHGARKLREARDLGMPLVVVLTNPRGAPVLLDDVDDVIPALHGDLVLTRDPYQEATLDTGLNGELTEHHAYLTGVVVLHEHLLPRDGKSVHASAFLPRSPSAIALPACFFRGPHDRVYEFFEDRRSYMSVHPASA
jgi:hypothetical protein